MEFEVARLHRRPWRGVSEPVLQIAVRADESAKAAHKRLDGINGSIDRFHNKLGDVERDVKDQLGDIEDKVNSILITLASEEGAERMRTGFLQSRRFWIGIAAALATSSVSVLAFTLLTRHTT